MPSTISGERRAFAARLSLCLGLAVFAVLASAAVARAAAPISPKLLGTTPDSTEASPATSTTPLVFGEAEPEDGVVIQGAKGPLFGGAGLTASAAKIPTLHPEYEIFVYAEAGCAGFPLAHGRADAFEESGIQVSVPENAVTTLSADQVNPANPTVRSACSGRLAYWEGNVPTGTGGSGGGNGGGGSGQPGSNGSSASEGLGPGVTTGKPEPPHLRLSPKAVANFNTPVVSGNAPAAGSVTLYAGGDCGGTPVARGSVAQLSTGFTMQVADNTTTTFSAVAVAGKRSDCSAPVTYTEDSTAPVTRVTMGPGAKTRKRKVVFRFADVIADPPGTSFFCKVDKAKWRRCASPLRLGHLRFRRHVMRVRAVDLAGNSERVGAKRIFTVVPAS